MAPLERFAAVRGRNDSRTGRPSIGDARAITQRVRLVSAGVHVKNRTASSERVPWSLLREPSRAHAALVAELTSIEQPLGRAMSALRVSNTRRADATLPLIRKTKSRGL